MRWTQTQTQTQTQTPAQSLSQPTATAALDGYANDNININVKAVPIASTSAHLPSSRPSQPLFRQLTTLSARCNDEMTLSSNFSVAFSTASATASASASQSHSDQAASSAYSFSSSSSLPRSHRSILVSSGGRGDPSSVAKLIELPLTRPAANEVAVRIEASAVNPIDCMLCAGYGRDLVSLAHALGDAHSDLSARFTSPLASAVALGREGVGTVVDVGDALWNAHTGHTPDTDTKKGVNDSAGAKKQRSDRGPVGARVWIQPIFGRSASGTFSEYALASAEEVALAPPAELLTSVEAACYPFTIATVWTALVRCAGIKPSPLPPKADAEARRGFLQMDEGGSRCGEAFASPLSFAHSVGLDRLPEMVQHAASSLASLGLPLLRNIAPITLSSDAPRNALVHGASGPIGLLAIQLLQRWGYTVYATTLPGARESLDKLKQKQQRAKKDAEASKDAEAIKLHSLPELHIIDTTQGKLQRSVPARSLSVFLDGVGGDAVLDEALPLLAPTGQFVTLRGEGVQTIDKEGLLQGAIHSGALLAQHKSHAARYGANYHWAISTPSVEALNYVRGMLVGGLLQSDLLPISLWRGLEAAPDALQAAKDDADKPIKPRHVVLIHTEA